jgi:hypothetical protein
MAIVFLSGNKITATSGDVKPTLVATNSTLLETDTNITFQYNGSAWIQLDVGVGDTVSESEITGTISDSKLASGISGSKITNGTISVGKLANGTAGKIIGFNASTGVIEEQDAPSAGANGSDNITINGKTLRLDQWVFI